MFKFKAEKCSALHIHSVLTCAACTGKISQGKENYLRVTIGSEKIFFCASCETNRPDTIYRILKKRYDRVRPQLVAERRAEIKNRVRQEFAKQINEVEEAIRKRTEEELKKNQFSLGANLGLDEFQQFLFVELNNRIEKKTVEYRTCTKCGKENPKPWSPLCPRCFKDNALPDMGKQVRKAEVMATAFEDSRGMKELHRLSIRYKR